MSLIGVLRVLVVVAFLIFIFWIRRYMTR